jgi:hypothetical protein
MAKPIYMIGGCKGGAGKSVVSMATIDYFQEKGEQVLLVETDTDHQDVWKCYKEETKTETIDLDSDDGWISFVEVLEANPDAIVVVNTAARNSAAVQEYGATLEHSLKELNRELITLWVMNGDLDGRLLLKRYMEAIPSSRVHVLCNRFHGPESKFEDWNQSEFKTALEAKGSKTLEFPKLASRCSDYLFNKRYSVRRASTETSIAIRAEMQRWRGLCTAVMREVEA